MGNGRPDFLPLKDGMVSSNNHAVRLFQGPHVVSGAIIAALSLQLRGSSPSGKKQKIHLSFAPRLRFTADIFLNVSPFLGSA
jgi:hypothetical protein